MDVDEVGRPVEAKNVESARNADQRDGLADEEVAVRGGAPGAVAMLDFDTRHGSVLVGREYVRQVDAVVALHVVICDHDHEEQSVDLGEQRLQATADNAPNRIGDSRSTADPLS